MAETELVKQLSIKQPDSGTYITRDIGVDYQNVEGLDTDAEAAKAKKATGDKNGKDITSYVSSITLGNDDALNIKDGTPNAEGTTYQLAMQGATGMVDGRRGFVPKPNAGDQGKVLKGDGTWNYSPANDNIAKKEASPATAEHKTGDRIIFQGTLYKVIDDIEIGDTLVVNSNIELSAPLADCMSEAPNLQDQICSNIEDGTTSTKSYSVGQYLVRDNKLYRVIDNISIGDSFTEDVNIFEVSTAEEITNLYRDLCDSSVTEDTDYAKHGHPKDSYFIFAGSIVQALGDISVGDMLATSENITVTNIIDIIQEMKTSFQDGVDQIYNAVVARGGTPSASTPSAIATAVNNLPNVNTGTYTFAVNDTGSTKDMGEANANRYVNAENVYTKGKADAEAVTWTSGTLTLTIETFISDSLQASAKYDATNAKSIQFGTIPSGTTVKVNFQTGYQNVSSNQTITVPTNAEFIKVQLFGTNRPEISYEITYQAKKLR